MSDGPNVGLNHATKQIFCGYGFKICCSDTKATYMYFLRELETIILQNGGKFHTGEPPNGVSVSVLIWPLVPSSRKETTKHKCHYSSIYFAAKHQEFDFSRHVASKPSDCVVGKKKIIEIYENIPIIISINITKYVYKYRVCWIPSS